MPPDWDSAPRAPVQPGSESVRVTIKISVSTALDVCEPNMSFVCPWDKMTPFSVSSHGKTNAYGMKARSALTHDSSSRSSTPMTFASSQGPAGENAIKEMSVPGMNAISRTNLRTSRGCVR
ncbi:hypothetical protein [Cohnella algarum]|uniref:hypothetical protein n=1 Tax=Cohnella algarum TaxID=2044859 RepID=UPI0019675635|nr:hypothetical protein [Cohnella algarum]MBN2984795.1 hypothetical protein [Cohnella algarum]